MDYFKSLVGANAPSQAPLQPVDDAFGDYAAPAAASPVSIPVSPADAAAAVQTGSPLSSQSPLVYTKWYRVWERTTIHDFYFEMIMIPFILLALAVHFLGTRRNKRKAKKFLAVAQPLLESEFALVGFGDDIKDVPVDEKTQGNSLISTSAKLTGENLSKDMIKEKSAYEFECYATGRTNTAFMDIKIILWKWYNPILLFTELTLGQFFESIAPKPERVECVSYAFDGQEERYITNFETMEPNNRKSVSSSACDPFIFAVVNKLSMKKLREERYDLSLTSTKDSPKLPIWASVMSESAEITDTVLTNDLVSAITAAEEYFEYLIISDQPIEKPLTIDEATPKKRVHICFKLPADKDYETAVLPLFAAFLRLPDHLTASCKFRPEVGKKVKQTRDAENAKLKKVADKEAEDDRMKAMEKLKKDERDRKLKGLSADEQKKFLEKEAEKNRKRREKKMMVKG